jgi:hypothetical protein
VTEAKRESNSGTTHREPRIALPCAPHSFSSQLPSHPQSAASKPLRTLQPLFFSFHFTHSLQPQLSSHSQPQLSSHPQPAASKPLRTPQPQLSASISLTASALSFHLTHSLQPQLPSLNPCAPHSLSNLCGWFSLSNLCGWFSLSSLFDVLAPCSSPLL